MKIAVISNADDAHIPFVQRHLNEQMLLVDPATLVADSRATFDINPEDGLEVVWNEVLLSDCASVWFRKPIFVKRSDYPVPEGYKHFARVAYLSFFRMLYGVLDNAFWLSNRHSVYVADNKALQLSIASNLGFNIPATVLTNDSKVVGAFRLKHESIVTKPFQLEVTFSADGQLGYGFFATKILPDQALDLSGLHVAPAIFQKLIENKVDVRVTVVGEKVFATEITTPEGDVDWRVETSTMSCETHELPEELKLRCVAMVRALNLEYGAFDFSWQPSTGIYWFLEVNPNGQWAFIEHLTGQSIGKSIADLLTNRQ